MAPSFLMSAGESSTNVRTRHAKNRHSPEEWEQQKELIKRLYLKEDKTMEETMQILKDQEGFVAGERKFKMQLKEWGFDKNIRSSIMQLIVAKATKRKFEEDKDTRFRYKGRDILPDRLSHYAKRSHVKDGKRVSPTASTPSILSYSTTKSSRSSFSGALLRAVSLNGSTASIASTVSALRQPGLALRRSFSNLSGRTFSAFKRRNSHHSDHRPMSPAEFEDVPFLFPSYQENSYDWIDDLAQEMSKGVIHGCTLCQIRVAKTVREPFNTLRYHSLRSDWPKAWEAAEEILPKIPPLCKLCRVTSYRFILSVLIEVARYHHYEGLYRESMDIYETLLQFCVEENLYECSFIVFNSVEELVCIYAFQGLLHEMEQKLLETIAEKESVPKLAWFCNYPMLARIYTFQQRPRDALREYGNLSTAFIEFYGLHSAFMHMIVFFCADACVELHDYNTSTDLYRRVLTEQDPTDCILRYRTFYALIGLSDSYRRAGLVQSCKKYAYKAAEGLRLIGSAPASELEALLSFETQCNFNLAVSFDKEGNFDEAESYFSQVVAGCEKLNGKGVSSDAVKIILALQHHYFDRPRRIDSLEETVCGNHLAQLSDAASGCPATLQSLFVTILREADALSRSQHYQRAEYLFNEAKGLLNPSNIRLKLFFTVQIAQHHRRKGEWKYVRRCLDQAVMLSKEMYGLTHACTITFEDQLAAFNEEMEKGGLSTNAIAQSLSLLTISSKSTKSTGSGELDEMDELEFLEDGMVWGQPPASLLTFA